MTHQSKLTFFARESVALNTIPVAQFRQLPHIETEQELSAKQLFLQRKAVIMACSDLTLDEFETLAVPDFNQLYDDICDLILKPSDEVQGEVLNGKSASFELLHPFENEVGEKISRITFTIPKVAHSEALAELTEDKERENFMFEVITGLHTSDLNFLSINDYLALKPQVGAFFQQSAAYFRPVM
ncbi:phage tail assembly protein [Vibrio fortis]|uniref:Phage tail assembly protein n=1 Tax=Vibrio fortis TaxID=212667 RepID=A0A5N3S3R4_9VIBR|nr:phage tail assembly protein [Vibrio fortis]KAB0300705.1 phage tail assembly protein [Vibrio fortis]